MTRRRFVVSLRKERSNFFGNLQVAFTLTPESVEKELFQNVLPIAWNIYDCGSSHGTSKTLQCDTDLAFCTAKEKSNGQVQAQISRVVPAGCYGTLDRKDGVYVWREVRRWDEDSPGTIGAINDTGLPQKFALCLVSTDDQSQETVYAPILLFSQPVPHDQDRRVNSRLCLRAYCGQNLTEMHRLREREAQPVLDERQRPWQVCVDDLPTTSFLHICRAGSGRVYIRNEGQPESDQIPRQEVHRMQETLDSTKDEVGNIRQVLDEVKQQVSTVGGETERAALNIQELIEEKSKVQADRAQKPIVDELAEVDAKLGELSMSLNLNQTDLKGCAERIEEYGLDTQVKLAEMDQRLEEVSQKTLGLERHMVTVISTLTELVKSMDKLSSDLRSQRVGGSIPLFRVYSGSATDHFYTTDVAERNYAVSSLGYTAEGTAALVFGTQEYETAPLYRLYSASATDHFYTMNAIERDNALKNLGYTDEGIAAYIYPTQLYGSIPLFRLSSGSTTNHFYTTDAVGRDGAVATLGYTNEGTVGYVLQA